MSSEWPAKYAGKCPTCGDWMSEGSTVTWNDDGEVVHAGCRDGVFVPRATPVCSRCWQATSVTGRCGCDE